MRSLRLEESNLSSKRQRRDLLLLLGLAVLTIGTALYFLPPLFTDSLPKGVEHDWTVQIGGYRFGLAADRNYTFVACGNGFARLPIPLLPFMGCSLLLACLATIWLVSRFRRYERVA
jgi:hypothetical protein